MLLLFWHDEDTTPGKRDIALTIQLLQKNQLGITVSMDVSGDTNPLAATVEEWSRDSTNDD